MWNLSLPWWEFVLRGVIVYVFLLIILRSTGKRQTGQLAPFDLVLLLVLSNAVQNAMNGGDNTLLGGIISATTLIALHYAVALMTYKSKKLEALIEGIPRTLIHDGVLNERVMRSELLTRHEVAAALRATGCAEIEHVRVATLENNGQITISLRPHST
ncbi:MAG: DUF421 domain-containing protein [Betaproteobacteria bacterium]|nr:MAG: DUF421 domain-containing protein [Betaproteobacteria bacterium]